MAASLAPSTSTRRPRRLASRRGARPRHQADHRLRGLHGRWRPQAARRKHALPPLGAAVQERDGLSQSNRPGLHGVYRRLLLQAADQQGPACALCGGPDLPVGLSPRRPSGDAAAAGLRAGSQAGLRVPGHLRQGELLPRDPRPRTRARQETDPDAAAASARDGHTPRGDERRALLDAGRRGRPRGPALRPDREDAQRQEPHAVRDPGVLSQEPRRDGGAVRWRPRPP